MTKQEKMISDAGDRGDAMPAPCAAVDAVVTCFNQGALLREAVLSLCAQTVLPAKIIVVDDGSTDADTLRLLDALPHDPAVCVPLEVVRQANGGVSAARNAGLRRTDSPFVLVLDGDDRVLPTYLEAVRDLLRSAPSMVAASAWIQTFGVLHAVVHPTGGDITAFLARNCCPATHILRRTAWQACGGYDETMRAGFEDWDFFLSLLETAPDAHIGIVPAPLFAYRTAPASANIRSMDKRLALLRYLIDKHSAAFHAHLADALLGIEATAIARLDGWESEIHHALSVGSALAPASAAFLQSPSYGDGGMAAAVRLAAAFPQT